MSMKIESTGNSKIKNIIKLRQSSRERKEQGWFLIEGWREISLALKGGAEIESLLYSPEYIKRELAVAEEKIIEVSKKVFAKISCRENPDGFLAVAKIKELKLESLNLSANPLVVVLEALEKPGNLGAILRTADAAGVDLVMVNDLATDIYNPNVIRASQGAVFTVRTVVATAAATIKFCRENKLKIFAATPEATEDYTAADYKSGSAIVVGTEDKGLSQTWLKAADKKINIKMRGKIDSLNVSVSTAVILFEALRQRGE